MNIESNMQTTPISMIKTTSRRRARELESLGFIRVSRKHLMWDPVLADSLFSLEWKEWELVKIRRIVLLDLNKTLAEEAQWNNKAQYEVDKDLYSTQLADALDVHTDWLVLIVTARPLEYRKPTEAKIAMDIPDFQYDGYFCKPKGFGAVHDYKPLVVKKLVSKGWPIELIYGIESNSRTRANYKKVGVAAHTRAKFLGY